MGGHVTTLEQIPLIATDRPGPAHPRRQAVAAPAAGGAS